MSFSKFNINIKEKTKKDNARVKEIPKNDKPKIDSFKFKSIKSKNKSNIKYISLDSSQSKNKNFTIHSFYKDAVSIVEEEKRMIDQKVEEKLNKLKGKIKKEVFDTSYNDGFKQGKEDAISNFINKNKKLSEDLDKLFLNLENLKSKVFVQNKELLLNLITKLVEAVIKRELSKDSKFLERTIMNILENVDFRGDVRILVSKKDYESIKLISPEIGKKFSDLKNISFEISENILDGDCVLESDLQKIDARLSEQIKNIKGFILNEK